jgi:NAD(P)-dependent dehydrogenase (short-subunit alcohol dehydrogenase family)
MNYLESEFSLRDRNIILTGAAGLLGRVFARALGSAGAKIHLLDIDEQELTKLESELSELSIAVNCYQVDITQKNQVSAVITSIESKGEINGLVNSAAVDPKFDLTTKLTKANPTSFTDYSLENWQRSMNVNLTGLFLVTQAVCKNLENQAAQDCSIINIASTYGLTGPDQRIYDDGNKVRFFKPLDYTVTKSGVIGFTKALAAYYRECGIRVNSLTPGGAFNNHDDGFANRYSSRTIMGRMADPSEYGAAVVFLSSTASSYMTGANLVIDGGWTAL